jgi:hypothetical protein
LGLEEVEYDPRNENWMITVGFSRPWNGPRTRAAEVLESMGNSSARMRRSFKTVLITPDGKVLSMKNRETID